MLAQTNGLNIIDYLVEAHGFEIDVHQEGASLAHASSGNNFADIRYMGGTITEYMSETTGFQWDNPSQFSNLQNGEQGLLHPEFTWFPEVLAGGVSMEHTNGDFSQDMTSIGVWQPSNFTVEEFHEHNADARMVYVGSGPNQHCADWSEAVGCHYATTGDFIAVLVSYIESARLAANELYTTTFFIPQPIIFNAEQHRLFQISLEQLQPLVESGQVRYAHFSEVVTEWRTTYESRPNIILYDTFEEADRTCGSN